MARRNSDSWNPEQNKRFEIALANTHENDPDRWQKVARAVGGNKSAEDVRRHYDRLVQDLIKIDSGLVPIPDYGGATGSNRIGVNEGRRLMNNLKL